VYEILSRISRNESKKKYTHRFVIGRCCLLPSSWNGSSISDTAGSTTGIDFLETYIGCSAIFHTFQLNPANITLVTAVSFLEIRRNHKGPNKVIDPYPASVENMAST
jgi:hypothetical protein